MRRYALITAVFLAGCASSPEVSTATNVTLNDGRAGHHIDCASTPRGHPACLTKASELCPLGYYAVNIAAMAMTIRCKTYATE
jgi:hypothetical protein